MSTLLDRDQWRINRDHVNTLMNQVLLALAPASLIHVYVFGLGSLINIFIALAFALIAETVGAGWIKKAWREALADHTALVSGLILALCMPPLTPWWVVALSSAFAIVVGKQIFGGTGRNIFNPAMVGVVFALICWPFEMSLWIAPIDPAMANPSLWSIDVLAVKFTDTQNAIAFSAATPLSHLRSELHNLQTISEIFQQPLFSNIGRRAWDWVTLAYLIGGLWLIWRRLIDWRAPFAVLLGLFTVGAFAYGVDPDRYPPPLFHLFSGGVMLGAFFVVTDPSSSCTTRSGKWLSGVGVGAMIYLLRTYGNFPDAVAFSVLMMNACVPVLDHYWIPKCFGEKKDD